ncbi:MAG: apolipoprotein N-acyltransferase [Deltaproteobacteria bacterium]|nr:MAG: apolipoprotein N-acyltransferase [Deltaproteobacteria bacterium]
MRGLLLLLATVVSAVLYGLSFPPAALRLLGWIALVPLLVALRLASSAATALVLAWIWTVVAAYTVGDWFPRAVSTYYQQPWSVGLGLFFGVSTFMAAAEYMAFAIAYRRLAAHSAVALPLTAAAAWVAAEFGRVGLFTGNPWALAGYSQVGMAPIVQIADVTGVYGVTFTLLAVNAALAELWLARRVRPARRRALIGLSVTAGVVAGENLDVYLRLTYEALRERKPAVVFWPESAMTFFLDEEPLYRKAIARVVSAPGAQLIAGGPRETDGRSRSYYNSAFLLTPDGTIIAGYDKQRLLPFAEYFPLGGLDLLRRRFARVREFTPGAATSPLPTAAGAAGMMICNEAMFPDVSTASVRAGAEYLVNLANDTWVGDRKFAAIVFDTVTLRAIEQRRYLVRASTSGPSGIVDPLGHVTVATLPDTRATVSGTVKPGGARTVYGRVGDLFAILCTVAAALALIPRADIRHVRGR